jgi:ATP-dependent DNA ligase
VNHLKVRSCLIDGEAVYCDQDGVPVFQTLRHGTMIVTFSCAHSI